MLSYMQRRGRAMVRTGRFAGLAAAVLLQGSLSAHAQGEVRTGFFSIFPARPQLHLPELGDVQLWKSDMQKARQAYRKGDYVRARLHLERALKNKNFIAAWYLGHIYRLGLGVPANPQKAFRYYRLVAMQYDEGEPNRRIFMITLDAVVQVANGYRLGIKQGGVAKNPARARRLFTSAARQGHPAAQYGLGLMFVNGEGVGKNPRRGLKWINNAAQKNFAPALAYFGDLYWTGKYVRKNRIKAVADYMVAAQTTREDIHPEIFDRLDEMSAKLSREQYQEATRRAKLWLKRHPLRRRPGIASPVSQ